MLRLPKCVGKGCVCYVTWEMGWELNFGITLKVWEIVVGVLVYIHGYGEGVKCWDFQKCGQWCISIWE